MALSHEPDATPLRAQHRAPDYRIGDCPTGRDAAGRDRGDGRTRRECGPLPFLIQRDGTWLYRGSPITRKAMVCLFGSALRRDAQGQYWLETPAERGTIEVEDAPFIAVELDWQGCGRDQVLCFRTNIDEIVAAGPEHPLRIAPAGMPGTKSSCTVAQIPYLHLRAQPGCPPVEARVARSVYYELAALAVRGCAGGRDCLGVWSQGSFFPIGAALPDCC